MKVSALVLIFIKISFLLVPGMITLFLLIFNKFSNFSDESMWSSVLEFEMRLSDGVITIHSLWTSLYCSAYVFIFIMRDLS